MREKTEKFPVFPFSIGCVSHSSVDVYENQGQSRKARAETKGEDTRSTAKTKNSIGSVGVRRNFTMGFKKIIKSMSNFFAMYGDEDEDDDDIEMEIGLPTDVRHVGHIGSDGSNIMSNINIKCREERPDIFSIPSVSLKQLELAMAAQAQADVQRGRLRSSINHFEGVVICNYPIPNQRHGSQLNGGSFLNCFD